MISSILDLDTHTNQYFYDSGYSDAASPGSSSTSSSAIPSPLSNISNIKNEVITSSGIHYLKLSDRQSSKVIISDSNYNYDATIPSKIINKSNYANYISLPHQIDSLHTIKQIGNDNLFVKPELIIREQPVDKFRFRYKSEMHGTHGSLMGENSEKSKKTYPTVELINYHGKALIRCSLYQNDKIRRLPHSHKLVVRHGEEDVCDPHDLYVSPDDGFRAVFQGMGIIHTAKKFIVEELISKKIKEKEFELTHDLTQREITQIKINADREAKDMNLNQVCLAFHAYKVNSDGYLSKLCEPVFSRPINNMKSALTGELKIVRLSAFVSNASGGEDLFLLVEKVGKKNIKVRFYEIDSNDDEVWEDWGQFCEADVHHQYAIALRTPPYKDKNIEKDVEVFIQLERPSDGMRSEPLPFKYKPSDFTISRKRAKRSNSPILCGGGGVGGLSSLELPETILNPNEFSKQHEEQQQTPQYNTLTLSEEFNKNELLNDLTRGSRQDSGSCSVPDEFLNECIMDSGELIKLMDSDFLNDCSQLKTDGVENVKSNSNSLQNNKENIIIDNNDTIDINNLIKIKLQHQQKQKFRLSERYCKYFKRITSILRMYGSTEIEKNKIRKEVEEIFREASQNGDLIQCAIQDGHPEFVPKMLKWIKRINIPNVLNYQNEYKHTCLHIACLFDRPEYINGLLQLGVDPNSPDINGNTPLHIAVENNLMMCVTKILQKSNYKHNENSLNTNLANYDGLTPLHLAIIKKNFQIVRKLIEDGQASVKLSVSKNGYHPLHLAIQQNDEEIVKYLIEKTVNLNEQNLNGDTPLKLAMAMNLDTIADLLVRNGGRVENEISSPSNYESPSSSLSSMSMSAATNLTTMDCDFENKMIKEDESSSSSSPDDDVYYELRMDDDNDNYANDNIVDNDNNVDNGDNIDIEIYENKNILFDDMCISQLSIIFNDNDDWKYLAELLKLRAYTCLWSSTENPTKSMFEHINRYERGKMALQDIIDACIKLETIEAVDCIEKMMKRQITTV